jgi:DEK C terminal domain
MRHDANITAVPPEVEASYATIIDTILAASDLTTVSAKSIRKGLQKAVNYDIGPQKVRIIPITSLVFLISFFNYRELSTP